MKGNFIYTLFRIGSSIFVITRHKRTGYHKKEFSMKNYMKLLGIITIAMIIGFSFISCEDVEEVEVEETVGTLTIKGLTSYTGKNVIAYGYKGDTAAYMASGDLKTDRTVTYVTVTNSGTATLKVWKVNDDNFSKFGNFDGNNQDVLFRVVCSETKAELGENAWGVIGTVQVNFSGNGQGEGTFTPGRPY